MHSSRCIALTVLEIALSRHQAAAAYHDGSSLWSIVVMCCLAGVGASGVPGIPGGGGLGGADDAHHAVCVQSACLPLDLAVRGPVCVHAGVYRRCGHYLHHEDQCVPLFIYTASVQSHAAASAPVALQRLTLGCQPAVRWVVNARHILDWHSLETEYVAPSLSRCRSHCSPSACYKPSADRNYLHVEQDIHIQAIKCGLSVSHKLSLRLCPATGQSLHAEAWLS